MKKASTFGRVLLFSMVVVSNLTFSTSHAKTINAITSDEVESRLRDMQHIPFDGKYQVKEMEPSAHCSIKKIWINIRDPQNQKPRSLRLQVVQPKNLERTTPVVILVPTIIGESILEPSMSLDLCEKKISSIIADVNDSSLPDDYPSWGMENTRLRDSVIALRTVIDFAEVYPGFDKTKIGMLGTSMGGILAGFMAGLEPERLKALVISVGGGNLPAVLSTSTVPHIVILRFFRMIAAKMSDHVEYEEKLQRTLRFDPLHFSKRANPQRILMVLSLTDTMVPYRSQKELHEALNEPSYLFYKAGGHVGAIADVVYLNMKKIVSFLEDRFSGGTQHFANR